MRINWILPLATFAFIFAFIKVPGSEIKNGVFILLIALALFMKSSLPQKISQWATAHHKSLLWITLFSALGLRLWWALYSGVQQTSDYAQYTQMAEQIAQGGSLISPHKQSGPGIIFGLIFWITGKTHIPLALGFLALVSFCQIPLTYYLGRKIFTPNIALAASFVAGVWPENWLYVNLIGNEVFLATFVLAAWSCIVRAIDPNSASSFLKYSFLAGLFLGMGQYMRATSFIFFCSFLITYLLIQQGPKLKFTLSYSLGFLLISLPILHFNYTELNIISISPSQASGYNLVIGTHPKYRGHYYAGFGEDVNAEVQTLYNTGKINSTELSIVERNQIAKGLGLKQILNDPVKFVKNAVTYKWPIFWGEPGGFSWSLETSILNLHTRTIEKTALFFHAFILIGGALSFLCLFAFESLKNQKIVLLFLSGSLLLSSLHMIVEIQPKYHHTIISLFPIMAFGWLKYTSQISLKLQTIKSRLWASS